MIMELRCDKVKESDYVFENNFTQRRSARRASINVNHTAYSAPLRDNFILIKISK